jgi:peptide/nickel transport system permease protein
MLVVVTARRFAGRRAAIVGAILVGLLVVIAVLAPWLTKDPIARDIDHGLSALGAPLSPSSGAWLGTDQLGRDVCARVAAGAGTSLMIASLATALALAIGLAVGLLAGYAGGWVDNALMRVVDLVLSFPFLLLAILLAALLREAELGSTSAPVVLTLGIVGWTTMARVIRGKAMSIARSEHVTAARAIGAGPLRIIVHHILPNVLGVVIVVVALGFAQNLLAEAALSYLGLGPPPPAPTWGRMLFEGRVYYRSAPHLVIVPGVAILLAVVGFNLLADGVRDVLDPKERA